MIRLNYEGTGSVNTTTIAVWSDTIYDGGDEIVIEIIPDFYDLKYNITGNVTSNKTTPNGGWLLIQTLNNELSLATGYATANLYSSIVTSPTWLTAGDTWSSIEDTWATYTTEELGSLISSDRLFFNNTLDTKPFYEVPKSTTYH